jgi:hypothetical protein
MSGPLAPTLVANLFLPLQEELVRVLHGLPALFDPFFDVVAVMR